MSRAVSNRATRLGAGVGCALSILCVVGAANAKWARPEDVPVDRLVQNLGARAKENPQDAGAWYSLGRAHSLAYTLKRTRIGVFNGDPAPAWLQGAQDDPENPPKAPSADEMTVHLVEGIRALSKAIELDPNRAEYALSLASLLQAGLAQAGEVEAVPLLADPAHAPVVHTLDDAIADLSKPENLEQVRKALGVELSTWRMEESRDSVAATLYRLRNDQDPKKRAAIRRLLKEDWQEQVTDLYFRAFTLALEKDSKITEQPMRGVQSLVAYEAATEYAKVIVARGVRAQDKVRLAATEASVKAWDKVAPSSIITPIVFSLSGASKLDELLAPQARVQFDLNGAGLGQTWSWVKPTTGILVWDPAEEGKITSGRQLFGSVSWWMLFDNGYSALSALDDDRDGELKGEELKGLSLWFDRNSNGVSDPGEVAPIQQHGIFAISTRYTSMDGQSPANMTGLRMADGRVLGTWDWVTSPVSERRASAVLPLTLTVMAGCVVPILATPRRRAPGREGNLLRG